MRAVRGLVIAVLVVALIGVGLYFADGYARGRVEERVAAELQTQLGTPNPPSVEIGGSIFLLQVVSGSISNVHVVADQIGTTNDAALAVADSDLVLTDVTSDDWFQTFTAGHAEGTALIEYPALQSMAGVPLTYDGGGRVQTETSTSVLGRDVRAVIDGTPTLNVREQSINLTDAEINVAGVNLPDFTSQAILRAVLKPFPITGVPFGLTVSSINASDDGVHATMSGDNLPLQR